MLKGTLVMIFGEINIQHITGYIVQRTIITANGKVKLQQTYNKRDSIGVY